MSKFTKLWERFKRHQIFRVALTYLVAVWLLVQIGAIVFPALSLPDWTITLLIVLLLFLFPVAMFLAWTHEKGPDGFTLTHSSGIKNKLPPSSKKRSLVLNIVLVTLLAVMVLWYFVRPIIMTDSAATNSALLENKSIAVLYFDNMSGDPDQEYFSDGITEEIITRLAKVEGIRVISRTSTRVYKGQPLNLKKIAEELNVSAVLEGSFRQSGNQIRVTAQLIDAETDEHIWAETYSRELKDIFQVQSDIAHAIAEKFEMNVTKETSIGINKSATANTLAYDSYLKARYIHYNQLLAKGDSLDFLRSKELYEKAIELDPNFAEAYAGLSYLYSNYIFDSHSGEQMDSARNALSEKAYLLDPNSSYVNHVRGWMFTDRIEPIEDSAFYYFKKARKIDPGDYMNYNAMGNLLRGYNLDDLALPYNLEAVKIDPLNARLFTQLGYSYWMLGDLENAEKSYQAAFDIGLSSGFSGANATAFWLIAHNKLSEAKKLIEKHKLNWWFLDSHILFLEGNHTEARKLAEEQHSSWSWWGKAEIYALLDDKERAIEALRNLADEIQYSLYLWIQNTGPWQKYKDDPEFQQVLKVHKEIYDENKRKYGFEYSDFIRD